MKIEQRKWTATGGWELLSSQLEDTPQLVLAFSSSSIAKQPSTYDSLKQSYPNSNILICSTAGEIINNQVLDNSLVVTAIHFEKTTLVTESTTIANSVDSESTGENLANKLPKENLSHCMVFSDGLNVNGTALVRGISKTLPANITVTGGLVGDGDAFKNTYVSINGAAIENNVVIVGFYGQDLRIGFGSQGGWDAFGPERLITKSENNVLYELDGRSALGLYKEYLGDKAEGLPGSGLLFPLSLRIKTDDNGAETEVVRTLLSVNEDDQSMTFAGDMPQGVYAKLMKANFDRLIDGAATAANYAKHDSLGDEPVDLAILISCVGRKLVLKERVEEEIEAVRNTVGETAAITGFYSYGEICPVSATEKQCQLHNQTMTITTFREV